MSLAAPGDSWDKGAMTPSNRAARIDVAPALCRLLAQSALSRAALGSCGVPLVLLDAHAKGRPVTYVDAAFQALFGHQENEALGPSLASLLSRSGEPLVPRPPAA